LRNLIVAAFAVLFVGCSSPPKTGVLAAQCQATAVRESDMEVFGFKSVPGKIVVLRLFATWCPFCKTDLNKIALEFKTKRWTAENVNLFLLAYQNHSETRETLAAFVKDKLAAFGIPREAVQVQFLDKPYAEAKELRSASGEPLFTGWKGIPYSLIFGKDGRLAFRGHFTLDDIYEQNHYRFVTELQKESCKI
jgi:hypothetical protein